MTFIATCSSVRKSINDYVKLRIKEIPSEIHQTFPNVKKIWKCENPTDFMDITWVN